MVLELEGMGGGRETVDNWVNLQCEKKNWNKENENKMSAKESTLLNLRRVQKSKNQKMWWHKIQNRDTNPHVTP